MDSLYRILFAILAAVGLGDVEEQMATLRPPRVEIRSYAFLAPPPPPPAPLPRPEITLDLPPMPMPVDPLGPEP